MAENILRTKLHVPPLRPLPVARPHLVAKLSQGSRSGAGVARKLLLISAPAGSGKTTLLCQFVAGVQRPVAWLSLDAADDEATRFWTYLIHACRMAWDTVGAAALQLLDTAQSPPAEAIPTILINELVDWHDELVLVLDDMHVIQNPSIHESLVYLLDHAPDNLHVVVSTRVDPPWPLARYRARNQVLEMRAPDMRFDNKETATFLNQTMGLDLSAGDVAALEARTEGWVAGLQLAAIAMQSLPAESDHNGLTAFVQAFAGSHVYIAEYLLEEVLTRQPSDVQTFLLQTSILDRLCAELCDAVTGHSSGREMLAALHRANLFVIPLDAEGKWFRYHHLFGDLLQARLVQALPAAEKASLHLLAADWYARNGFERDAIHHAVTAKDFERVAALIDQVGLAMVMTGRHNTLRKWLGALPEESFRAHPRLEIYRVLIDLSQGTLDMGEQTLLAKEDLIRSLPASPVNDRLRLEALGYLCLFLAHQNTSRTIEIARETLADLPECDLRVRSFLYSALYRAYGMEGNIAQSTPAYRECLQLAHASGRYGLISITTMVRAFDLCQYGLLDEAIEYCQVILDAGTSLGHKVFYPAGPAYIGLAGIYLERNDLETAADFLERGIELCRQSGVDGLYTGYAQQARLLQAKGDFAGALAQLRMLEQTFRRWDFTLVARQVSIRLAMDDVAGAARLLPALGAILRATPYAQRLPLIAKEAFKLSLARILIAQDELVGAGQLLDEIQATAAPGKRFGRMLEVYMLRARIEQNKNSGKGSDAAIRYLQQAIELAAPAGFVVLFLEEGPALIPLLQAIAGPGDASATQRKYARKLLHAAAGIGGPTPSLAPSQAARLVEPLTPRELEVLQLIARGDSNQAIADQLVVTVRTVKKHVTNILGKLGVSNRTQAAARARELSLLAPD